jgi:hypothetical protein
LPHASAREARRIYAYCIIFIAARRQTEKRRPLRGKESDRLIGEKESPP